MAVRRSNQRRRHPVVSNSAHGPILPHLGLPLAATLTIQCDNQADYERQHQNGPDPPIPSSRQQVPCQQRRDTYLAKAYYRVFGAVNLSVGFAPANTLMPFLRGCFERQADAPGSLTFPSCLLAQSYDSANSATQKKRQPTCEECGQNCLLSQLHIAYKKFSYNVHLKGDVERKRELSNSAKLQLRHLPKG